MNRILIATDGSDGAWAAVEEGLALASEVGAAVTFVAVRHPISGLFGDHAYQEHLTEQLRQVRTALDRAEAEAARCGVEHESDILEGDAVSCIVEAASAWKADLLVVGSRGLGAVASALIGSVSRGLLTRSPVPVMIVRTKVPSGATA
jgi:nucleotide-binding universal stress UspA family protein